MAEPQDALDDALRGQTWFGGSHAAPFLRNPGCATQATDTADLPTKRNDVCQHHIAERVIPTKTGVRSLRV